MSRSAVHEKPCRKPGAPASPRNRAYSDHPNAASTPSEISVSIVAVAWRRLRQAATWNGQAPQTATGAASVSASHCQSSNCSAGTIDSSTTGTDSSAEMTTRSRSGRDSSTSGAAGSVPSAVAATAGRAVYPADSTWAMRSSTLTAGAACTLRLLGGVVHGGRDPVQPVQPLLDAVGARTRTSCRRSRRSISADGTSLVALTGAPSGPAATTSSATVTVPDRRRRRSAHRRRTSPPARRRTRRA